MLFTGKPIFSHFPCLYKDFYICIVVLSRNYKHNTIPNISWQSLHETQNSLYIKVHKYFLHFQCHFHYLPTLYKSIESRLWNMFLQFLIISFNTSFLVESIATMEFTGTIFKHPWYEATSDRTCDLSHSQCILYHWATDALSSSNNKKHSNKICTGIPVYAVFSLPVSLWYNLPSLPNEDDYTRL